MANRQKAAITFTVDPDALRDTLGRLADLDRKAARRALRKGMNELTKLVLAEARARVPKRTGQLRKSLGRRLRSYNGGAAVTGVVKPRAGVWVSAGRFIGTPGRTRRTKKGTTQVFLQKFRVPYKGGFVNPVKYAHLVEYGRVSVTRKKKKVLAGGGVVYGVRVRAAAPRPFLRPAWEHYRTRAVGIIGKWVRREMNAFWERSRKRYGRAA